VALTSTVAAVMAVDAAAVAAAAAGLVVAGAGVLLSPQPARAVPESKRYPEACSSFHTPLHEKT